MVERSLAAGLALGMVMLGKGQGVNTSSKDSILRTLFTYVDGGYLGDAAEISNAHRIRESRFINTDTTTPGALMALALMYLRTNDVNVASHIDVQPSTV